jgi:thioredoxin reductase (NADPH)
VSVSQVPMSLRSWISAVGEIARAVNAAEPLEEVLGERYANDAGPRFVVPGIDAEGDRMRATSAGRERAPVSMPVLFVIDDDPRTMHVLRDDLSRRLGQEFGIVCESSADAGLAALRELAVRRVPVALLIVGQELSGMSGVAFLGQAHQMHPLAVRILLVERDYSARSPIVAAMTLGQADSHITKPWMLEQELYSVVSECLADWARNAEAAFELFNVVGLDDRAGNELRELLTRFNVPFRFVAADSGPGRHLLREQGLDESRLPVLVRYDGHAAVRPDSAQLVAAVGGTVRDDVGDCDVAIVGAGPAGLAAAVYAASEGLRTVVLEEAVSGGQAGSSPMIRNYPGFPHGISGYGLTRRTCEQAWMFGAHMVFAQRSAGLERTGDRLAVHLDDGHQVTARAVVAATGIAWRRLGVPRLDALVGAGVFYGAAGSEARAMAGRDVFVVGAGNSAGQAALYLARYARQVTMLVRGDSLGRSMSDYLLREIEATASITVRLHTEVCDGDGAERLESLTLRNRLDGRAEQVQAAALFALIGGEPRTQWLPGAVQLRDGYVLTGRDVAQDGTGPARWLRDRAPLPLETSMPGVFAVGDVRYGSIKRVASAVGDGATAIRMIHEYLAGELAGPPVRINKARAAAPAAAPL